MWKKWNGSQQVPVLHGISREHYAMHATQLFIERSGVPHAHVECAHAWDTLDRKSTLFKLIATFSLKGVVFMFWHDIVHIELLYCVTNFQVVWIWNKVSVVENVKSVDCTPPSPTCLSQILWVIFVVYLSMFWFHILRANAEFNRASYCIVGDSEYNQTSFVPTPINRNPRYPTQNC